MRILMLGAYGVIGSAVLSRLHQGGHAVVGLLNA
jgi:nucleoside-diphosphate-sugar epimerase